MPRSLRHTNLLWIEDSMNSVSLPSGDNITGPYSQIQRKFLTSLIESVVNETVISQETRANVAEHTQPSEDVTYYPTLLFKLLKGRHGNEANLSQAAKWIKTDHVLKYHQQCKDAVLGVAVDHTWIRVGTYVFMECPGAEEVDSDGDDDNDEICTTIIRSIPSRKYKRGRPTSVSVHPWWLKFMAATKDALSESMDPETIRDKGRVKEALAYATSCSHCRKYAKSDFGKFLDAFVNEVEERMKKIELVQPGAPGLVVENSWNWDLRWD